MLWSALIWIFIVGCSFGHMRKSSLAGGLRRLIGLFVFLCSLLGTNLLSTLHHQP